MSLPQFQQNAVTLLLVQMAAILVVSHLLGTLTRRLSQPLVIAEIIAGIVLGPSLLGRLWPGALTALFPSESLGTLNTISQTGLVLFMFLVGLEIDPRLLRDRGSAPFWIGLAGIAVPFGFGAVSGAAAFERYAGHAASPLSLSLFLGVAMSVTAFPVLARILSERRLLGTRLGALSIGAAAVGDITAWCLLAFVVAVARAQGLHQAVWTTFLVALFLLVAVFVVRPVLKRFAAQVGERSGLSPSAALSAFLLLLVSALFTESIGIHALFGAFVAGAILPNEGGLAASLGERMETLTVTLFLPLFFAYSGLRTDVGLLNQTSDWLFALAIVAVATAAKFGASALAARFSGSNWREAAAIGVLMNTRGLMELIVLNIGLDLGVISPTLFTILVLMALVTTVATTPILNWIYPEVERIQERATVAAAPAARSAGAAPFSLLLCVSDARSGPAMATLAAALTADAPESARLYALHLVPPSDRPSSELRPGGMMHAGSPLGPLIQRAGQLKLDMRPLTFVSADPGADIARTADVVEADLVMLGWHRPLLVEGRLGGVVRDVLNRTRPHVAVLVDRGLTGIRRVLVAFAGTPEDVESLRIAKRLSGTPGVEITLLHVVEPGRGAATGPGRTQIGELIGTSETQLGNVRLKVVEHASAEQAAVEEAAAGYDLVIVGMSREWGLERKGLVFRRERLLAEAQASVLAIRPGLGERRNPVRTRSAPAHER
jgi:Kef-type K+ transport system membrane component KefB/nucleotide-binding universal stress UspA family protein